MATLSIRGVKKSYASLEILKEVDIELAEGEFLVLLGPSGCGKTTLLNIIAGLIEPSAGEIRIGERMVNNVHPKDRDIAMVFQSYALYPNMNVAKNMEFGLSMRGVPKATRQATILRVAKLLQIEHLLGRKPSQLSGGQRQRVAIGRALVREPKVFLFDEPLSNLDAKLRVETRIEIKRLHQRLATTIVYVTHDQIEAMTLATRIAIMRDGRIEQMGTPEEIYDRPANLYVAGFVGSPAMNTLAATVRTADGGLLATLAESGQTIGLPAAVAGALAADSKVVIGVRPEAVKLAAESEPNALRALVEDVELIGPEKLVVARIGKAAVTARVEPHAPVRHGQTCFLAFGETGISLFDPDTTKRL